MTERNRELTGGPHSTNPFTTCFIDRASGQRLDDSWVEACLRDRETRFIPVWQLKNLFVAGDTPATVLLSPDDVRDLLPEAESTTLLGLRKGQAYFALGLFTEGDVPPATLAGRGQFQDLRQVAALAPTEEGALLAYARAMSYWHHRHRFCGDCGSPTVSGEGGHVRLCTNERCKAQIFPRTDPAIIVIVSHGERALLGRKPEWAPGLHSTLAGFVEPGESLEDAVMREVREEAGVELAGMRYHSSQPWPFPSSLMLGFMADAANDAIHVDGSELEAARWFTRQEMRDMLQAGTLRLPSSISVSFRLIRSWFDAGDQGALEQWIR